MSEAFAARQMWHLIEPVHAVLYYAPEVFSEAASLGYATDTRVNGHEFLPSGGHEISPLVATVFPHWRPRNLPRGSPALRIATLLGPHRAGPICPWVEPVWIFGGHGR
jgi:hypothetical protein